VNDEAPLRIDASAVETLTLPCIQVILAAMRGREAILITNPSAAFIGVFDDLGIEWIQYLDSNRDQAEVPTQNQSFDRNAEPVQQQATEGVAHNDSNLIDPHQINETCHE